MNPEEPDSRIPQKVIGCAFLPVLALDLIQLLNNLFSTMRSEPWIYIEKLQVYSLYFL